MRERRSPNSSRRDQQDEHGLKRRDQRRVHDRRLLERREPGDDAQREAHTRRRRSPQQRPRQPSAGEIGDTDRERQRHQHSPEHDGRDVGVDAPHEERPEAPRNDRHDRREQRDLTAALRSWSPDVTLRAVPPTDRPTGRSLLGEDRASFTLAPLHWSLAPRRRPCLVYARSMASIVPDGQLVCGMALQVQSKSKTFREDWEVDADSSAIAALARQADASGFFYVAVSDHVAVTKPMDEHMQTTWYDTVATLGLARRHHRARAPAVTRVRARVPPPVAHREVVHDARRAVGWARDPRRRRRPPGAASSSCWASTTASRGRVTDDAIDVDPRRVHRRVPRHHAPSALVTSPDAGMAPRPRQARIPIWVGGSSKAALRRAAERGDGWLPQGTPRDEMPAPDRVPARTPQADDRRRADRPRGDHRGDVRR